MKSKISHLGTRAMFLVPSTKVFKLRDPTFGHMMAKYIHDFLINNFDGFTMTSGNINGYFDDNEYDEHREYRVAIPKEKEGLLKEFLGRVCKYLNEKCIYLEVGNEAMLIYPSK